MMRLIDADALMKELEREVELADDWKTAHEIVNVVKYFPTIEPERKKGKWEQQTGPLGAYEVECAVCSVCNDRYWLSEEYSIEDIRKIFAYCPSCGARMEGKE